MEDNHRLRIMNGLKEKFQEVRDHYYDGEDEKPENVCDDTFPIEIATLIDGFQNPVSVAEEVTLPAIFYKYGDSRVNDAIRKPVSHEGETLSLIVYAVVNSATYPLEPNPADYADGVNDPQYLKDYPLYVGCYKNLFGYDLDEPDRSINPSYFEDFAHVRQIEGDLRADLITRSTQMHQLVEDIVRSSQNVGNISGSKKTTKETRLGRVGTFGFRRLSERSFLEFIIEVDHIYPK